MGTVPTFRTWVVGELVTASFMNTNIRDGGNFLTAVPTFEGRQTVAQSIPNSSGTAVLLDTEDIDSDGGHSTVTNTSRYTAQTAGWYRYGGACSLAANATGTRIVWVNKNAATVAGTAATGVASASIAPAIAMRSRLVQLALTDFLEMIMFQNSGVAQNTVISGVESQPSLGLQWVRS
jgi:hypothetical protein